MARQAEAEREKRAKIINAEGESLAAAALVPVVKAVRAKFVPDAQVEYSNGGIGDKG